MSFANSRAILIIWVGSMISCSDSPPFSCPYQPNVVSVDVPFKYRGFGIQFWNEVWAPLPGETDYEEMVNTFDRLTCTNTNLVHIHFNVELTDSATGHTFDRSTSVSPSDARISHVITLLKDRGFEINLKVGYWHNSGGWSLMNYEPTDPAQFFTNWTAQLVHYAALAESLGVEYFDISYEQNRMTYQYAPQWTSLINSVKSVYTQKISANFQNPREAQNAVFLSQLDIIMTSIFYKHVNTTNPTVAQLVSSWDDSTNVPTYNVSSDSPYRGIGTGKSILDELVALYTPGID